MIGKKFVGAVLSANCSQDGSWLKPLLHPFSLFSIRTKPEFWERFWNNSLYISGKKIPGIAWIAWWVILFPLTLKAEEIRSSLALGDRTGVPNTSISVPVQVASDGGLVGVQFDVLFNSADIEVTGITPAALATNHTFKSESLVDGRQRFLVYSLTNDVFDNGIIGNLELDLSDSFAGDLAALSLSNINFTTADGTVLTVDVAPFVQLTDPTQSVSAQELGSLDLSAIAIATAGEVARVEFQVDGRTVAFDAEGPFSASWVVDAPGNVLLTAVAIDEGGNRGRSSGIQIDVTPSPFLEAWRQANFNAQQQADPGISGFNSDPDGDGIINFFELAFGLNPLEANLSGLPALQIIEENGMRYLALRYQHPEGMNDLVYTVEISGDLSTWLGTTEAVTESILETSGGLERILAQAVNPLGEDPAFIRIRIEPAGF